VPPERVLSIEYPEHRKDTYSHDDGSYQRIDWTVRLYDGQGKKRGDH